MPLKCLPMGQDAPTPTPEPGLDHLRAVMRERIPNYPGGQVALAIDLGVGESIVSNWLRGALGRDTRGARISLDHLVALGRVWHMTMDELLGTGPARTAGERRDPLEEIELAPGEILLSSRISYEATTRSLCRVVEVYSEEMARRYGCGLLARARWFASLADEEGATATGGGSRPAPIGRHPGRPRNIRRKPEGEDIPRYDEDGDVLLGAPEAP